MEFKLNNDTYSLIEDGVELGYVTFKREEGRVILIQTFTHEHARGRGVAKILNDGFFKLMNEEKANLTILCGYSATFYEKNKEKYPNINVLGYDF